MDSSRYEPSAEVIAHPMGQEMILLHLETSRFFELNRTGARLWQLLAAGCRRGEIRDRLAAEFDVSGTDLDREIDRLLAQLIAEKLVSEHADG